MNKSFTLTTLRSAALSVRKRRASGFIAAICNDGYIRSQRIFEIKRFPETWCECVAIGGRHLCHAQQRIDAISVRIVFVQATRGLQTSNATDLPGAKPSPGERPALFSYWNHMLRTF